MFLFKRKSKKTDCRNAHSKHRCWTLSGTAICDVGVLRGNNEDNFILGKQINENCSNLCETTIENVDIPWFFAGVFDGMGGGEKGEIAALTAAQVFRDVSAHLSKDVTDFDVVNALRTAFLDSNNQIVDMQDTRIYGTTGTVLAIGTTSCKVFHLGDSRAYLYRDDQLFPLTRDQTLSQIKIDTGLYLPNDPQIEADKHKLTEYIGKDRTKKHLRPVESEWISIENRDILLLCSDGLYDMCSDQNLLEILRQNSTIQVKAKKLIRAALEAGGHDNVTCILLEFSENS